MTLLIDSTIQSVGDMLHEAAVTPSLFRPYLSGDVEQSIGHLTEKYLQTHEFCTENGEEDPICRALIQCGESEAMAWSYAAAVAADIDPMLVFHSSPRPPIAAFEKTIAKIEASTQQHPNDVALKINLKFARKNAIRINRAYDGEGADVVAMMAMNAHYGIHGLQAAKMTTVRTFPKMIRWLQV